MVSSSIRRGARLGSALALTGTLALALFASPAAAGEGPAIGNNRYSTSIAPVGQGDVDVDDYVGTMFQGEKLTCSVNTRPNGSLEPQAVLIDPSGNIVPGAVFRSRRQGRSLILRKFIVPTTGDWTVRVSGANSTTGDYTVVFRVRKNRPRNIRKLRLGGGQSLTAVHDIDTVDGAKIDLSLSSNPRGEVAVLQALTDPGGQPVPNVPAAAFQMPTPAHKPIKLDQQLLTSGNGVYQVTVGIAGNTKGFGNYNLRIAVYPPSRPQQKKVEELSPLEPRVDVPVSPHRGFNGHTLVFTGQNFATNPTPRVFFGPTEANVTAGSATQLTVSVPAGVDGTTVDLRVTNPDGQSTAATNSFEFVAAPVLTGIRRLDDSIVAGGPLSGGEELKLLGTGFNDQDQVRFGGSSAVSTFISSTELRVTVPGVATPRTESVFVMDEFGRESESPFVYEYKDTPAFGGGISPSLIPVGGTTVVSATGSGFSASDICLVNGNSVAKTFVDSSRFTFTAPNLPAGTYSVQVQDSFGTLVNAPNLVVKAAPTIVDLEDANGNAIRDGILTGGASLRVIGTNLTSGDAVLFGNNAATVTANPSSTRLDVTVPAGTVIGAVNITVTDALNQGAVSQFQYTYTSPAVFPAVSPGAGFSGPTAQPADVGSSPTAGHDAKAIARWDVIPFQTFESDFHIGVVAFHINGIDRVEFSVNGGPFTPVTQMKKNPRTNVWEYTALLKIADIPDGLVEVRAIVYPKTAGIARVLAGPIQNDQTTKNGNHSLFLHCNGGLTLQKPVAYVSPTGNDATGDGTSGNPYQTPQKAMSKLTQQNNNDCGGGTIYLKAGNYAWGPEPFPYGVNTDRWVTMKPAPGLQRSQVVFDTNANGHGIKLTKVENVTFSGTVQLGNFGDRYLWLDNCIIVGPGKTVDHFWASGAWYSQVYLTNVEAHDIKTGLSPGNFIRDCYVHDVSFGCFQGAEFVVNSRAERFDDAGMNFHGDVFHWFPGTTGVENFIAYNLDVIDFDCQGIFAEVLNSNFSRMDNCAFVNVHISKNAGSANGSWWEMDTNHLLLWHCSIPDQPFRWDQGSYGTSVKNVSIVGSVFYAFTHTQLPASSYEADNNHYVDPNAFGSWRIGTNQTTGDPKYKNVGTRDYTPDTGSPLLNRVTPRVPADCSGKQRGSTTAVGAFAGANE